MGRPLRKDVNGVDVIGTPSSNTGIRVNAYFGSAAYTEATYNSTTNYAYIYKQRGKGTFVVANQAGTKALCKLQSGTPTGNGQMQIKGYRPSNGTYVAIAKMTKRLATDFSGARYKWVLANDSTNDYIVLTAI
ncbi:hypothetical protein EB118_00010 [bacterium]|nr:hypothetical protein [bacterium]